MAPSLTTGAAINNNPAETSKKGKRAETTEELTFKYVFYQDDKKPFDIQPIEEQRTGPSPYAATPDKGPSVLKSYEPKRKTGKLDSTYKYTEVTPPLGREIWNARLSDILEDDDLVHDLAVTIAERGVVFFKNQTDLTIEDQKKLTHKLGDAAGRPKGNGLHIHPIALAGGLLDSTGDHIDPEIFFINSKLRKTFYKDEKGTRPGRGSKGTDVVFHSDITFEPVPASFSALRIIETPSGNPTPEELAKPGGGPVGGSGGDTLWASGYALAEKISPSFLSYLETLKGEFYQPVFKDAAAHQNIPFYSASRGAPENIGDYTTATHPLVRTNPTTGWKSIFGIGSHLHSIHGVTPEESEVIRKYLSDLLYNSPEIQLRYKWSNGDIAIWDNRSTYHSAILDLDFSDENLQVRTGLRSLTVGERPFFDPKSKLRRDALKNE